MGRLRVRGGDACCVPWGLWRVVRGREGLAPSPQTPPREAPGLTQGPRTTPSRLPGALRSMSVLSQGHLYAQRFPSSHVLRPFTLYPWTQQTVLEPICVCKHLRDLGPSLNILHISTNRFPSAPVGRIPLLWPLKPLGSLYLLLYIQLLSLVMSEDNC